jgi:outer membrane protein assembly factor BamB
VKRRILIGGALVVLALGAAIGVYAYNQTRPTEKRGSAKQEFDRAAEPKIRRSKRAEIREPWPTYGFDSGRTHVAADFRHRPPYRKLWGVNAHDTVEFPPSVGYGSVFVPQQKGLFLAVDAKTGRVRWRKQTKRCAASSPALAGGVVYQSYMDKVPCPQDRPGASGFVIAWNARTGRKLWKWGAAPFESSPLYRKGVLYVGSWDHHVYAVDAKTGRKKWSFQADEQVNTSAAYWKGTIYIATDGGSLYALSARSGKLRWRAQSNAKFGAREFFYATPTVAYGRVFIGNTDGTMYVFGARSGKLRWARPLGTYVYGAAAVWRRRVYVGTYDGRFYALDAATGDTVWQRDAPGAVHAAATVMDGLVYYATCSTCGSAASRTVKRGPDGTLALAARTGRLVWRINQGKYANPVIADEARVYVTGRSNVYAFRDKRRRRP